MKKTWEEFFTPRHGEVDRNGKLRLDSYFEYIQEIAANHASELGCGLAMLQEQQKMWVLSRLKLTVFRPPVLGEPLRVRTWPSGIDKLFATREIEFTSKKDSFVCAAASTDWLLLDAVRMRPLRAGEELDGILPDNSDLPKFHTELGKLPRLPEGLPSMETFVRESMIDVNRHLNNARCAAIVYDWLCQESGGKTPLVREIQINFVQATPSGSVLYTAGTLEDGHFRTETSGGHVCESILRFQAEGDLFHD